MEKAKLYIKCEITCFLVKKSNLEIEYMMEYQFNSKWPQRDQNGIFLNMQRDTQFKIKPDVTLGFAVPYSLNTVNSTYVPLEVILLVRLFTWLQFSFWWDLCLLLIMSWGDHLTLAAASFVRSATNPNPHWLFPYKDPAVPMGWHEDK